MTADSRHVYYVFTSCGTLASTPEGLPYTARSDNKCFAKDATQKSHRKAWKDAKANRANERKVKVHLIPRRREGTVLYVCLLFQYNTKCSQGSTILKKSKIQSEEVTQNPNPRVYVISFTCAISYSDLIVHQAPAQRQPKISYLQIIEYLTLHASQPSPTHEKKNQEQINYSCGVTTSAHCYNQQHNTTHNPRRDIS